MDASRDAEKRHFLVNFFYWLLVFALGYLFLKYLLGWVMPFVLAFLLAALLRPAVRFAHRKTGIGVRACAVALVLLAVAAFLALCVLGASRLGMALADLGRSLPQFTARLAQALQALAERLAEALRGLPRGAGLSFDTSISGVTRQLLRLTSAEEGMARSVQGIFRFLPALLLDSITTVVAACFIAADYPDVSGFLLRQLPARHRKTALGLKAFFLTTMAKLARAYCTLMLLTFAELAAGLLLLRVHHAVAVAAAVAVVDILPVLGTGTVMIPWALAEFLLGNPALGFGLAVLYGAVTVVRNILEPKIVGSHVGLHPLVTLAAMYVGFKALGFAGMIFLPLGILLLGHLREGGIVRLWKD